MSERENDEQTIQKRGNYLRNQSHLWSKYY